MSHGHPGTRDPPHPSVKKFGLVTLKDAMKFKSVIRQCNVR